MATEVEQVIDRYIAAWNETDPATRRELIARTWSEDGSSLDPLVSGEDHDGIDAMIGGVQTQFPGYRFRRMGDLEAQHRRTISDTRMTCDNGLTRFHGQGFRIDLCRFRDAPVGGDGTYA